jgi:hypothetical protein
MNIRVAPILPFVVIYLSQPNGLSDLLFAQSAHLS